MSFRQSCLGFPESCPNPIDVSTWGSPPEEPDLLCGCSPAEQWARWVRRIGDRSASAGEAVKTAAENFNAMAEVLKKRRS